MNSSRKYCVSGALVFAVGFCMLATAVAQDQASYYEEQFKLIRAPNAVKSLGDSPFGESINLYNGRLQFSQTDVSIPGNNALPVAIGRRITTGESLLDGRAFGRWDLEIPHIHGTFSRLKGWLGTNGTKRRCSSFGAPPLVVSGPVTSYWDGTEYWQGTFLYVPGHGEQQLLSRSAENTLAPGSRDAYPVVTAKFWSISCIPTLKNDSDASSEGFLAISPDGTQYRFDWMVKYRAPTLHKSQPESNTGVVDAKGARNPTRRAPSPADFEPHLDSGYKLERDEVWLLPTEIKDRYGNTVTYTYDASKPRNLQRISSSDGRAITLTHITAEDGLSDMIKTVSDGTRTWIYGYKRDTSTLKTNLMSVQLPDGTSWNLSIRAIAESGKPAEQWRMLSTARTSFVCRS